MKTCNCTIPYTNPDACKYCSNNRSVLNNMYNFTTNNTSYTTFTFFMSLTDLLKFQLISPWIMEYIMNTKSEFENGLKYE